MPALSSSVWTSRYVAAAVLRRNAREYQAAFLALALSGAPLGCIALVSRSRRNPRSLITGRREPTNRKSVGCAAPRATEIASPVANAEGRSPFSTASTDTYPPQGDGPDGRKRWRLPPLSLMT